jgi:hypothetical protein
MVPETLENFNCVTWLMAREDFVKELQQPSYGFYFISWRFKLHVSITFLDYLQV